MASPSTFISSPRMTGKSFPLGATSLPSGVNFSLFSRHATAVDLLLFDDDCDPEPAKTISLDPTYNRTYHYWHVEVPGIRPGQLYAYRVFGPFDRARGFRFDPDRILLDPYARAVVIPRQYNRRRLCQRASTASEAVKGVVADWKPYDWEGDAPLHRPASQTIIYELHVRGFTRHASSGLDESIRGTYAGLIQKLPYLKDLGITAVELMPVFQFDAQDCPPGLVNYWGYAPISFFAPHRAYSSDQSRLGPVNEFRDMVKALHAAGIEVLLDVVFNHTSEGSDDGPTQSLKGIDNPTYYILEQDQSRYANYSGTGNTLKANHPIVRRMIIDSLCYWVEEMHVDGFRFDLASILARDSSGHLLANPPVLWDIESDPRLAGTKFIAEAWDAAGLYQVGSFVGDTWREWNGRFRDDIRDFFRCERGSVRRIADRILGSPEIYGHESREAEQSVNFVACHDGFSLNDLVSYNGKHNEGNGEDNRDGSDDNRSYNWGVEGATDDPAIESVRNRLVKSFLAVTVLSLGVPMILMGDEVRRTQAGNNNAYCQDNEISWFDWSLAQKHGDVLRFVQLILRRRVLRDEGPELGRISLCDQLKSAVDAWHGVELYKPDWRDCSHSLAVSLQLPREGLCFYLILNGFWEALRFELPTLGNRRGWHRWIDTALQFPNDIVEWENTPVHEHPFYTAGPHSVVVLIGM